MMEISGRSVPARHRLRASMGTRTPMSRAPGSAPRRATPRLVTTTESRPKRQHRGAGVALLAVSLDAKRMNCPRCRLTSKIPGGDGWTWTTFVSAAGGLAGAAVALLCRVTSLVWRAGSFAGRLSDMGRTPSWLVETADLRLRRIGRRVPSSEVRGSRHGSGRDDSAVLLEPSSGEKSPEVMTDQGTTMGFGRIGITCAGGACQ